MKLKSKAMVSDVILKILNKLRNDFNSQHHRNYVGLHEDKNGTIHGVATISVAVESYYEIKDIRILNATVDDAIQKAVDSKAFENALTDKESCEPQQERLRNV